MTQPSIQLNGAYICRSSHDNRNIVRFWLDRNPPLLRAPAILLYISSVVHTVERPSLIPHTRSTVCCDSKRSEECSRCSVQTIAIAPRGSEIVYSHRGDRKFCIVIEFVVEVPMCAFSFDRALASKY